LPSKNSRVHWDSNSQSERSIESVGVQSLTLSYTQGSTKCDSRASFLACTFLVASPRLGLQLVALQSAILCKCIYDNMHVFRDLQSENLSGKSNMGAIFFMSRLTIGWKHNQIDHKSNLLGLRNWGLVKNDVKMH
jgi:hypothetical protein